MTASRRGVDIEVTHSVLHAEVRLSEQQLAAAAGISPAMLSELVQLGVVEPASPGGDEFGAAAAVRLKRMLRLQGDLDLDLEIAAIIVDLVERLERLEAELERLREAR